MLSLSGRSDPLPLRIRAAIAAVPVALAAITFAADPIWPVGLGLLVALSPWLLIVVDRCPPMLYPTALSIAAVAALMARWRITDLSLMLLVFLVGQTAVLSRRRVAIGIWAACVAVPVGWQIASAYGHMVAWIIGMSMALLSGAALRGQQEAMARLEAAQEELAAKAVTEERRRIARDVHDLAAHSMAVTMLHLTGARLALADGEVAEAEAALLAAERAGRSSLDEIRRAVGVLADPGEGVVRTPEPTAADVGALVEDYRRAGMTITFVTSGDPVDVNPVTGLALFRLVQESLANAARHAPGAPVAMDLEWNDDAVTLRVCNKRIGSASGQGHGLVGMRERVEQLGGTFRSDAVDGEWQVRASLPCHSAALEPR